MSRIIPFNHTRADGPYDPCSLCAAAMKREKRIWIAKGFCAVAFLLAYTLIVRSL